MEKSKLKLSLPEWVAIGLTVLFVIATVILVHRPKTELTLEAAKPAVTAEIEIIDLNTADAETLQTLPGIGEELARRILEYRTQQGGFHDPSELLNIEGIGDKTYAELIAHITVRTEEEP